MVGMFDLDLQATDEPFRQIRNVERWIIHKDYISSLKDKGNERTSNSIAQIEVATWQERHAVHLIATLMCYKQALFYLSLI